MSGCINQLEVIRSHIQNLSKNLCKVLVKVLHHREGPWDYVVDNVTATQKASCFNRKHLSGSDMLNKL